MMIRWSNKFLEQTKAQIFSQFTRKNDIFWVAHYNVTINFGTKIIGYHLWNNLSKLCTPNDENYKNRWYRSLSEKLVRNEEEEEVLTDKKVLILNVWVQRIVSSCIASFQDCAGSARFTIHKEYNRLIKFILI